MGGGRQVSEDQPPQVVLTGADKRIIPSLVRTAFRTL